MIYVLYDYEDDIRGYVNDEETAIVVCEKHNLFYRSIEPYTKPLWPKPDLHPKAEYKCSAFCCDKHGVVDVYVVPGKFFDTELHVSSDGSVS